MRAPPPLCGSPSGSGCRTSRWPRSTRAKAPASRPSSRRPPPFPCPSRCPSSTSGKARSRWRAPMCARRSCWRHGRRRRWWPTWGRPCPPYTAPASGSIGWTPASWSAPAARATWSSSSTRQGPPRSWSCWTPSARSSPPAWSVCRSSTSTGRRSSSSRKPSGWSFSHEGQRPRPGRARRRRDGLRPVRTSSGARALLGAGRRDRLRGPLQPVVDGRGRARAPRRRGAPEPHRPPGVGRGRHRPRVPARLRPRGAHRHRPGPHRAQGRPPGRPRVARFRPGAGGHRARGGRLQDRRAQPGAGTAAPGARRGGAAGTRAGGGRPRPGTRRKRADAGATPALGRRARAGRARRPGLPAAEPGGRARRRAEPQPRSGSALRRHHPSVRRLRPTAAVGAARRDGEGPRRRRRRRPPGGPRAGLPQPRVRGAPGPPGRGPRSLHAHRARPRHRGQRGRAAEVGDVRDGGCRDAAAGRAPGGPRARGDRRERAPVRLRRGAAGPVPAHARFPRGGARRRRARGGRAGRGRAHRDRRQPAARGGLGGRRQVLRSLVAFCLRQRVIVLALLALFVAAGIAAYRHLPVQAYPDVTNVQVQVITLLPGHAAEEVERLVTIPVENEMNGIPRRASMRSISIFGLSVVTIVFEDDADRVYVRQQTFERFQNVSLPAGASASLSPDSTPVGEIFRYTLVGPPGYSPLELRALEDWVVERKLRQVPGVVDVAEFGGPNKQYQVLVDPVRLRSYGVTLHQVFDALASGNKNAGGSYIEHGPEMYIVRGLGLVRDERDIGNIAGMVKSGTPVRIHDLATVATGAQVRLGLVGKNDDDDVVEGIVLLRKGENALEVLQRIRAKVEEINRASLPRGVRIVTHYDRTDLIHRTLHTVLQNMAEGIFLVLVVLVAFLGLRNLGAAAMVALVIPLSLLGAFILLDLRDVPANLISMGAVDFGIIVDPAVFVVENILRLLDEKKGRVRSLGTLIVQGTAEVGTPQLFSTAIIVTAFVPL